MIIRLGNIQKAATRKKGKRTCNEESCGFRGEAGCVTSVGTDGVCLRELLLLLLFILLALLPPLAASAVADSHLCCCCATLHFK